jgi:hypothetical protein
MTFSAIRQIIGKDMLVVREARRWLDAMLLEHDDDDYLVGERMKIS